MGAWTLEITKWTDGLTGLLDVRATRKCGRIEDMTVYRFPAGWRMNAAGLPKSVAAAALRFARETGL